MNSSPENREIPPTTSDEALLMEILSLFPEKESIKQKGVRGEKSNRRIKKGLEKVIMEKQETPSEPGVISHAWITDFRLAGHPACVIRESGYSGNRINYRLEHTVGEERRIVEFLVRYSRFGITRPRISLTEAYTEINHRQERVENRAKISGMVRDMVEYLWV